MGMMLSGPQIVRVMSHHDGRIGIMIGMVGGLLAVYTVFIGLAFKEVLYVAPHIEQCDEHDEQTKEQEQYAANK
jgi:uncharacterized membrane protein YqhA